MYITKMDVRTLFALLFFINVSQASLASFTRIVGGHYAPHEFGRFHVSLQNVTGHHVCGGAVVSGRHLITAAHCVNGAEPQYINAVVGTTNLNYGGKQYDILSITIHKNYNASIRTNDIAVLKIKGLFNLHFVDILGLSDKTIVEGDVVNISGFGAKQPNGESSRHLYSLDLPVFSQETCKYAMRYSKNVTDSMFCTFTRSGQGTCHGDSGGPILMDNKLVGVVSWGIPCAVGFPDVHTRIKPYISWIRQQTKYLNCQYKGIKYV